MQMLRPSIASAPLFAPLCAIAVCLALPGCVSQPEATQLPDRVPVAPISLTDVSWRLVEFQSMDDAQGTTRPANPDDYTMKLGADGKVAFGFDCNRGMGSWSSQPSPGGMSGSIHFSQVASTLMACPGESMGGRLSADVPHMTSYLMKDGRLYVSLRADAGTYVWEPMS